MLYIVYLVCMILYFVYGISWDRMTNFVDITTLEFVICPCVLMLFCTRSFQSFGRAFAFVVGKREYPTASCRASMQAVKMVMQTAAVFGGICFLIGMVNSIRSQDWSSAYSVAWMYADSSVAMLSLFYALVICALLLPVYFMLKKHVISEKD